MSPGKDRLRYGLRLYVRLLLSFESYKSMGAVICGSNQSQHQFHFRGSKTGKECDVT